MLPDVEVTLRLQNIDSRIAELQKEIAALPKHIAEIEKKLVNHERRLDMDRAALSANQKDRKRLEGDIQTNEAKISKLKDQMLGAKNNDQYRAFQNEIDFCAKEIRQCEDRILELMGESEPLDKNVKAAEVSLKDERKHVDAEKATTEKRTAVDRKALVELQAERTVAMAGLSPAVASLYERVRKSRAGIAIAEVLGGRCAQCHMTIRPQFLQELKRNDTVMTCESCGRILFYHPPKSAEDLAGVNALSGR